MTHYEIYVVTKKGKLKPTGVWDRGYKVSDVEDNLGRAIKKINKPCVIVQSHMKVIPEPTNTSKK